MPAWLQTAGVLTPVVFGMVAIIYRMGRIEAKVDILMTKFINDLGGKN